VRPKAALEGPAGDFFAYDAANLYGQEMSAWLPWLRSPDTEIDFTRDRVVARTRDLVRNDGWATGAVGRTLDNTIGAELRLRAMPDHLALSRVAPAMDATWADEFAAAAEAEWRLWAHDLGGACDTARTLTFPRMARLALRHALIDGEALAVLGWEPERVGAGAHYATSVQVVDPDRLSNPDEMVDTEHRRGGVEIDEAGAPLGYWIRRAHQNDWYDAAESMVWDFAPRTTLWGRPVTVHYFDPDRAGQHRGVGVLVPVLARLKMLGRYDAVELQQAVLQTVFGTFVESPYDADQVRMAMESPEDQRELSYYQALRDAFHQQRQLMLGGVRIPTLAPGEKIAAVSPQHPARNFTDFEHAMLRNVAAAIGVSAEQVTQDWSRTNYSSARAAMLDAWKTLGRIRGNFTQGWCTPIYAAFLEEAIDRGRVPLPADAPPFEEWRTAYARCRWLGVGRGWIDPVKERQGAVLGLDAGFSTLDAECSEMSGTDWREMLHQRAREVALMKSLGLKLPDWAASDPAQVVERKPPPE